MKSAHHARTPSFTVADRLPYPNAIQPASLAEAAGILLGFMIWCVVEPRRELLQRW
jgi:hypothetical protein